LQEKPTPEKQRCHDEQLPDFAIFGLAGDPARIEPSQPIRYRLQLALMRGHPIMGP
jgi:hypothetical protein